MPLGSVADYNYYDNPIFDKDNSKKIFLNIANDIDGPRGSAVTWFHEHGHLIDDAMGDISTDDGYLTLLKSDMNNIIGAYSRKYGITDISIIERKIGESLFSMREHSAVSDIFEAISGGRIKGISGHGLNYWGDSANITAEAFAHMFEAQFDDTRYKQMKLYFPESLKYFEKKIGGLLN